MTAEIVKFPFTVSRRAHARKPRASKNGTPEERTIKAVRHSVRDALMPIDMPLGGDTVYRRIGEHREAVAIYNRCVDAESEAEGKVSDEDFARFSQASKEAFDRVMFAARCLIIDIPATRTGLVRWSRYVRQLLIDWRCCKSGSPYLPDEIGGKPWIDSFLRGLSVRLCKMGDKSGSQPRKPRRTHREAMSHRREFNDAMRQRIRKIAKLCGLSEEDIKPALKLTPQGNRAFRPEARCKFRLVVRRRGTHLRERPD